LQQVIQVLQYQHIITHITSVNFMFLPINKWYARSARSAFNTMPSKKSYYTIVMMQTSINIKRRCTFRLIQVGFWLNDAVYHSVCCMVNSKSFSVPFIKQY